MKYGFCVLFLAARSANNLDKSAIDPSQAKDYLIKREFRRVVRYNCAGTQISDQVETVSPPNIFVKIEPKTKVNLDHADYTDLQTSSSCNCLVSQTQFNIDTSPNACNMQVVIGLNEIKYSFSNCDAYANKPNGTKACTTALHVDERGSLFINVRYQEQTLQGKTEVRPQPTDCATTQASRQRPAKN